MRWGILSIFLTGCTMVIGQDIQDLGLRNGIKLHGNLNFQLEYYNANHITPRKKDFSWMINGNPTLEVAGIQVPLTFLLSNYENKFYQPYNQFGISPYYKWAKVHLGYRNITYSPYTLAGHQMLGVGFDLTPKNFRFGFMYGQLRRSTSIDPNMAANPLYIRPKPTYRRLGYAAKVGYGTKDNFVDFIYFSGWDKDRSLSPAQKDSIQPAENKTIGVSTKVTPVKNLTWHINVGLSAYTINKNDATDTAQRPMKNRWISNVMAPFVSDKLSTHYFLGGETGIRYQMSKWTTGIQYKRIDPGYQSMGAYFFQSDIQEITFSNQFRLDSGRLNINTNIGFQKDNLEKQKKSTAKRFIGNANINYVPNARYGVTFNYNNYGITNNPLVTSTDDELFKQVNNSVMLMPFFNWMNEKRIQNLNVVLMFQSLSTPQSSLGALPTLNTFSATTGYNHTWVALNINTNATVNYMFSKIPQGDIGSFGGTVGGMAPFLKNKLQINANASYLNNTFNNAPNGYTFRGTLGLTIPVDEHHNFQVLGNYLNNKSDNVAVIQSFNEFSVQFIYGFSF